MTRNTPFNGHRNWTHWNVALWLANDEPLYRAALRCKREHPNVRVAAQRLQAELGGKRAKTPDGAMYSVVALAHALAGLE